MSGCLWSINLGNEAAWARVGLLRHLAAGGAVGIVSEAVNLTNFASGFLRQISKLGFTCFALLFGVLQRVLFDGNEDIYK
jgi:hypothetical protein